MVKVGRIHVRLDVAGGQIVKIHALGIVIHDVELGIFLREEPNGLGVRAPERFPCVIDQFPAMPSVDVHDIKAPHRFPALALIHRKGDLGSVGGYLGVMLMLLRCLGQVDRMRTIGVHDEDFPVIVDVGFVSDFEPRILQFLAKGGLGLDHTSR